MNWTNSLFNSLIIKSFFSELFSFFHESHNNRRPYKGFECYKLISFFYICYALKYYEKIWIMFMIHFEFKFNYKIVNINHWLFILFFTLTRRKCKNIKNFHDILWWLSLCVNKWFDECILNHLVFWLTLFAIGLAYYFIASCFINSIVTNVWKLSQNWFRIWIYSGWAVLWTQ